MLTHGFNVSRNETDRPIAVSVFAGKLVEHQLIDRITLGDYCGPRVESIEERLEVSDLVGTQVMIIGAVVPRELHPGSVRADHDGGDCRRASR